MTCRCPAGWCGELAECRIARLSRERAAGAWQRLRGKPAPSIREWTRNLLLERRLDLLAEIECLEASGLGGQAVLRLLRVKRAALKVVEGALGRLIDG